MPCSVPSERGSTCWDCPSRTGSSQRSWEGTRGTCLVGRPVWEIHSILIIHRFHICKFTYVMKFICNPKSVFMGLLSSFTDMQRKNLNCPMSMSPAQGNLSSDLLSCSSTYTVNKWTSHSLCSTTSFFAILCILLVISLLKMAPSVM